MGRESDALLNTNGESVGSSLQAAMNQNFTNADLNHRSSTRESRIDEEAGVANSPAAESNDDDDELAYSIGLSRSPTTLKCDAIKVAIMENNLRLRIEKVSFYNRIDPINKNNVKLRRNIYKALVKKQEKAEDAFIVDLVQSVSDTCTNK